MILKRFDADIIRQVIMSRFFLLTVHLEESGRKILDAWSISIIK